MSVSGRRGTSPGEQNVGSSRWAKAEIRSAKVRCRLSSPCEVSLQLLLFFLMALEWADDGIA